MSVSRSEQLQMEVTSQSGLTLDAQVIFSTTYNRYLSPHTSMDAQQFSQFLQLAGGSQGHAILYLLPTKDLSELLEPEYSCLAKLCGSNIPHHSHVLTSSFSCSLCC